MKTKSLQLKTLFVESQFSDATFLKHKSNSSKSLRPQTESKVSFLTEYTKEVPIIRLSPTNQQQQYHRLKSALSSPQKRQLNLVKRISSEFTSKSKLESLQQRVVNRYQNETYLQQQHKLLIKNMEMADQEVIQHLNFNYISVQQNHASQQNLLQNDPSLAYTLYDALCQLDTEIIQKLFKTTTYQYSAATDQIGQTMQTSKTPSQKFRLEYIKQTTSILNEPLAQLIRKASQVDKELSGFIEGLWKFFVVLLDIISQWTQDRYSVLLEEQTSSIKKELQDSKILREKLQEQLILKVKGNQLNLIVERKKFSTLQDNYHVIQQDMRDLNIKYEQIGSLENAEGEMQQMGVKIKEMQNAIQEVERYHQSKQKEMDKQIKGLAQTFIKWHGEKVFEEQKKSEETKYLQLIAPPTIQVLQVPVAIAIPPPVVVEPGLRRSSLMKRNTVQIMQQRSLLKAQTFKKVEYIVQSSTKLKKKT